MANYHTNDLAIAADTENMKKVLLNFAANLAANSEETGLDFHEVAGIESVKAIYEAIEGRLSGFYEFSFSGAPIDEEIPSNDSLGWESSTSSASGYASQVEAMKSFASRLQGSGASVAFEVLPSGRPLSDEASVELTQYGDRWVIQLMYSTGWEPNSRELNLFFLGLPEGEYGVAFLDADEYDDYETISVFSGVHHGRALLHDVAEEGGATILIAMSCGSFRKKLSSKTKMRLTIWRALRSVAPSLGGMTGNCGENIARMTKGAMKTKGTMMAVSPLIQVDSFSILRATGIIQMKKTLQKSMNRLLKCCLDFLLNARQQARVSLGEVKMLSIASLALRFV